MVRFLEGKLEERKTKVVIKRCLARATQRRTLRRRGKFKERVGKKRTQFAAMANPVSEGENIGGGWGTREGVIPHILKT